MTGRYLVWYGGGLLRSITVTGDRIVEADEQSLGRNIHTKGRGMATVSKER